MALAGVGITAITFWLWVQLGMSLETAMNSSIAEFAAVFYAGLIGLFEGGGSLMFYAIAMYRKARREQAAKDIAARREQAAKDIAEGESRVIRLLAPEEAKRVQGLLANAGSSIDVD